MGREDRITDLSQLGAAWAASTGTEVPIQAPIGQPRKTVYDSFYAAPPLYRLRVLGNENSSLGNQERLDRVSATVADVLKMHPSQRRQKKLKVVVSANTGEDGGLPDDEQNQVGERHTSHITVVYPLPYAKEQRKITFKMLRCSDLLLYEDEGMSWEEIVRLADETQPEYTHEMQRRAIMNIKTIDALIGGQKDQTEARKYRRYGKTPVQQVLKPQTTQDMERLNSEKDLELWRFFELSSQLEEATDSVKPLYYVTQTDDRFHARLTMFTLQESSLTDRMRDKDTPVVLGKRKQFDITNINVSRIRNAVAQYGENRGDVPDHLLPDFHIWQLLQDPAVWTRR